MSDDIALVDSNVLVYALYRECEHHERCRALLDQSQAGQVGLCVTPQNLAEFYAIVTDPRHVAVPRQPAEALDAVERVVAMPGMTLLPNCHWALENRPPRGASKPASCVHFFVTDPL